MARKGEIDPWNIDVIDVTDKFLRKIEEAKKLDLRVSGRVLLYAAILVRMKADAIAPSPPVEEDFEIIEVEENEELEIDEIFVEEVLRAQRRRIRKISTLKDLIKELKKAEAIERRRKRRRERIEFDYITSIPHEENLEREIAEVEDYLVKILKKKSIITLFSIADTKERVIGIYLPLLHLVQRRRFTIEQREFYDDIEIRLYEQN
ncbi:MAG: segregation/condensation protein A [Archaeoglobaceae archaeon]